MPSTGSSQTLPEEVPAGKGKKGQARLPRGLL